MGSFDYSSQSTCVRSDADVGPQGLARSLCSISSQVQVLYTELTHPWLYGAWFVHWCAVILEEEGTKLSKLFPQCWHVSMKLSKMSKYAEALIDFFTGAKGLSPIPEKQPNTIIPPSPQITLGTLQSDKYCSLGYCQTLTCPLNYQSEKIDFSLQRIALHCTRVQ